MFARDRQTVDLLALCEAIDNCDLKTAGMLLHGMVDERDEPMPHDLRGLGSDASSSTVDGRLQCWDGLW